ncbi:WD repeat-containing protein 36-like [Haliotis rufescens]|uniref:WD repeat-containing protein 36-like n=1 Tax=Haliotis rufescens TaxID=6454 RepID=UPI00201F438E|nr:WD repeat-containing protein 36-like [Haliotis rufescens]
MPSASKIFSGYRALGYVSNDIPLVVRHHQREKENYVCTSVGKSFHTYNCSKLGIVSVSDIHPADVTCLAADAKYVYSACGTTIQAFKKGRKAVYTYEGHKSDVHILLPFGEHLISVEEDSHVFVWDIESQEIYLEMNFYNHSFGVTAMLHPNTYLNKILVGSKQGIMQLWNIRVDRLIYSFTSWDSPILVLEQAPAVDIVGCGLADGRIILHNLKLDETLMKFTQDWGPVTTISFRTDGHPVMATGSTAGHIALWDLEDRKLKSQMRDAHSSSVTGMRCLPSEPLMVTSSADNTLKVWIFDQPDGGGRLLRHREGHKAPPTRIRHYGRDGQNIISAGQDSLVLSFSTLHDKHNKSMGRASYNKKQSKKSGRRLDQHMMPPVTEFTAEQCRESDWDNMVACHRGERVVTTWSYQRSTMGKHKFENDRFHDNPVHRRTTAEAVEITPCGNFALIGYSSGHVDMYNLQSGIFRGTFGTPTAHSCSVRGIAVDGLNQLVVTAGADGQVNFWKFKTKVFLCSVKLKCSISRILLHRESAMLAVSLDDYSVVVVDIDTRREVRVFSGHSNIITDMTFSPDARWLVTSSMDSSVRVWDLPTGKMIDCFLVDSAVTSLSMSPTSDFLVTTHVDDLGIYLWSNMTLYTYVSLKPLPEHYEPQTMAVPSTSRRVTAVDVEDAEELEMYEKSDFKSPAQISDELVTLSLLPNSRWQNLLHLDVIKLRNKPKQPPKVPKAAPFFLPTVPGLQPKFVQLEAGEGNTKKGSRILSGNLQPLSPLAQLLEDSRDTGNYSPVLDHLKELGPSAIDVEIRSLAPSGGGNVQVMAEFMKFINHSIKTNHNFEIVQAYLGLFLKLNADVIAETPELVEEAKSLVTSHRESWRTLEDLFTQSLCLVTYLRSATL